MTKDGPRAIFTVDANRVCVSNLIDFLADIRQISGREEAKTVPLELMLSSESQDGRRTYKVGIMKYSCMSKTPWLTCNERELIAVLLIVAKGLEVEHIEHMIALVDMGVGVRIEADVKDDPIT